MINCCVYGVPLAPVYKGARGGGGRPGRGAPRGGVLLPLGVGPLPFLVGVGEEEGKGEEEKERGGGPPCPKPIRFGPRGPPHTFVAAVFVH